MRWFFGWMPYKLTDALAMKVPVIANDVGDLGALGQAGYLKLVPFGEHDRLAVALEQVFADRDATRRMVEAGRRLYLRQFSYAATRANMKLILDSVRDQTGVLPVAKEFAEFFAQFQESVSNLRPHAKSS